MSSTERNYPEKRPIEANDDTSLPAPGVIADTRCRCDKGRESAAIRTTSQIAEPEEQDSSKDVENGAASSNPAADDLGKIDGGTTAWLVVLGAWCASFCSYGWINSQWTLSILESCALNVRVLILSQVWAYSRSTMKQGR